MRTTRLGFFLGSAVIGCQVLALPLHAQDYDDRAPVIRLSSALGSVVSNYVEPSISLSEDAYVFVISVDVDRSVQVLHPVGPGVSVKMTSRQPLYLPRFFAGYGERQRRLADGGRAYTSSAYNGYEPGLSDARGTIIALASRKPFNLGAVAGLRDWDASALRRLVDGRDPESAASALARAVGVRGEPIGYDVLRFAGASHSSSYNTAFYDCSSYYGSSRYDYAFTRGHRMSSFEAAQYRQAGFIVAFLGVDACGQPQFAVYPKRRAVPANRPPAIGAFPKSRVPARIPRNPARDETVGDGSVGANSPASDRHNRGVTTGPSRGRASDPRHFPERGQREPAIGAFPERARAVPAPARAAREPSSPPARVPSDQRARVQDNRPRAATGAFPRTRPPERVRSEPPPSRKQ